MCNLGNQSCRIPGCFVVALLLRLLSQLIAAGQRCPFRKNKRQQKSKWNPIDTGPGLKFRPTDEELADPNKSIMWVDWIRVYKGVETKKAVRIKSNYCESKPSNISIATGHSSPASAAMGIGTLSMRIKSPATVQPGVPVGI